MSNIKITYHKHDRDQDRVLSHSVDHSVFTFSGGETQVRLESNDLPADLTVKAHLYTAGDLIELALVKNAIDNCAGSRRVTLVCPYLPYARQDRVCAPGEAFSLKFMADLINLCRFDTVELWDVHSRVATDLIDRAFNVTAWNFISHIPPRPGRIIIAPDKGAVERARICARHLNIPMLQAEKWRNPINGAITRTTLEERYDLGPVSQALIIDDICDGGRTFLPIAKILKERFDCSVALYVTHGIFSQGQAVFDGLVDEIYTPHLFPNVLPVDRIIQI